MSIADNLRNRLKGEPLTEEISPLVAREAYPFAITAGELRGACETNPEHPKAAIYRKATLGMPDNHQVIIDRPDLEALLDDKDVIEVDTIQDSSEGKIRVRRKKIVPRKKPGEPDAPEIMASNIPEGAKPIKTPRDLKTGNG